MCQSSIPTSRSHLSLSFVGFLLSSNRSSSNPHLCFVCACLASYSPFVVLRVNRFFLEKRHGRADVYTNKELLISRQKNRRQFPAAARRRERETRERSRSLSVGTREDAFPSVQFASPPIVAHYTRGTGRSMSGTPCADGGRGDQRGESVRTDLDEFDAIAFSETEVVGIGRVVIVQRCAPLRGTGRSWCRHGRSRRCWSRRCSRRSLQGTSLWERRQVRDPVVLVR